MYLLQLMHTEGEDKIFCLINVKSKSLKITAPTFIRTLKKPTLVDKMAKYKFDESTVGKTYVVSQTIFT